MMDGRLLSGVDALPGETQTENRKPITEDPRGMKPHYLLLAIEICLVPACTALLGTKVELPLAALALCIPQIMSATWLCGPLAGMLLIACAAGGWLLPTLLTGQPTSDNVDVSSIVLSSAVLIGFVMVTRQWQNSQARASAAAEEDPLTGLLNRRGFLARVDAEGNRCARDGRPLALAFVDCDHFKQWNDTHGHAAGDQALTTVGAVLRANVRSYDAVGRLGGDEFAILLAGAGEEAARAASSRLMDALGAVFRGKNWPLSCSMGVAVFPKPTATADMIAAADAEMYAVKQSGRGRCHVRTIEVVDDSVAATVP
jgi:diguanylate cyclase (GGDEF)-like protein